MSRRDASHGLVARLGATRPSPFLKCKRNRGIDPSLQRWETVASGVTTCQGLTLRCTARESARQKERESVCVCEREREREGKREQEREGEREREVARARERESESVCERERKRGD